jgi:hypothetical protein
MSTSVKTSEQARQLLDDLRAKIVLTTGRKRSRKDILETIVKFSSEREEELIRRLARVRFPFSRKELRALMRFPRDLGVATNEEEIDEILYSWNKKKPS